MARLNDEDRRRTIAVVATACTDSDDKERVAYLVDMADDVIERIADKGHGAAVSILALCFDQFGTQMPESYRVRQAQLAAQKDEDSGSTS